MPVLSRTLMDQFPLTLDMQMALLWLSTPHAGMDELSILFYILIYFERFRVLGTCAAEKLFAKYGKLPGSQEVILVMLP